MPRGKQPRPTAKAPKSMLSVSKEVKALRQLGCWLRSSHTFKECVTAHQSSDFAPIIIGAKHTAEA